MGFFTYLGGDTFTIGISSISYSDDGLTYAYSIPDLDGKGKVFVKRFNTQTSTWYDLIGGVNLAGINASGAFGQYDAGDVFGNFISLSSDGNRLLVHSIQSDKGRIDIFDWNNTTSTWSNIFNVEGANLNVRLGNQFAVLSPDGNHFALGSKARDQSNSVNIYSLKNGTWTNTLFELNTRDNNSCVFSNDGNTFFLGNIGSVSNPGTGWRYSVGQVRVWKYNITNNNWSEKATISNPDNNDGDYFGFKIKCSSDGNIIAISAPGADDTNKSNCGKVYVYTTSNDWTSNTIRDTIVGNNSNSGLGSLGLDLSSDGTMLAIGSASYDAVKILGISENMYSQILLYSYNNSTNIWEEVFLPSSLTWNYTSSNREYYGKYLKIYNNNKNLLVSKNTNADYPTSDRINKIETYVELISTGLTASQLKTLGFTAIQLKKAGFTASELKAANFTATELKTAGYTATELKTAGYTASELKAAGFTASQLKAANFTASQLKAANFTATELKTAGYTATELKTAGYTASELKAAGFSISDLQSATYSDLEILSAGYTATELKTAGYTASELKTAGFTATELKVALFTAFELKLAGFNASELKAAGFDATELKAASFTAIELKAAGFTASELKVALFTAFELKLAGFNATELKVAGFDATELKAASFAAIELKVAGFTATELKVALFTATELKAAGFTTSELKAALFTASELKAALFTKQELLDAGYSKNELIVAGFTFELNQTELKVLSHYTSPISAKFTHSREDLSVVVNIQDNRYTKSSGVAYCQDTGHVGVVCKLSVNVTNTTNNQNETNFSSEPINVELTLPMANTNASPLKLFKVNPTVFNNPKIINSDYPVSGRNVTYNATTGKWETTLPSLSTFIVVDPSAPSGGAGGDPHVQTVHGEHHLLPNDWKLVKLYEHNDMKVVVKCEHIGDEVVEQLHKLDEDRNVISINKDIHKYVTDLTYITELAMLKNNEEVFKMDLLNDKVLLHHNESVVLEKLEQENEEGLFSLTHKRVYPKQNLSSYLLHLDSNNVMKVQIDNFWDDINFVKLHLFDKENVEEYVGEFFKHDEENRLE